MIYAYQIIYLKFTNNITAQLFHYLLFGMKLDAISIIISGITDLPLKTVCIAIKFTSIIFNALEVNNISLAFRHCLYLF